ncbi:stabilin-2-like [Microplitis mediator]|uniref:stabilin-2-like n=1 Tax=Microplitis mediator TaxID=375433 RepID=UPI002556AD09|nr:stabilin-2-like [Microplitis mediator]
MLGDFCEMNIDCHEVMHAQCSKYKTCVCRPNHIALNSARCAPLLGENCWNNEECATINSVCLHSKCQCKNNYTANSNNLCESIEVNEPCNTHKDCRKTRKYTRCALDKVCQCDYFYVQMDDNSCAPILNRFCDENDKCAPHNSTCINNKCQCKANFEAVSRDQCLPKLIKV